MARLLLETYWIAAAAMVAAAIVGWMGFGRGERRYKWAAFALADLGITLAILSAVVQTSHETVLRRTEQLASAIGSGDWRTVGQLVHPQVLCYGWTSRQQLLTHGQELAQRFGVRKVMLGTRQPVTLGDAVSVRCNINTEHNSAEFTGTASSTWQLTWVPTVEGWQLKQAEAISFMGGLGQLTSLFEHKP
jgi:hypothetical protein